MANIVVPDESKVSKEGLLLGDVTITVADCDGNPVQVNGLMANDLDMKFIDGSVVTLAQFIQAYTGSIPNLSTGTITNSDGDVITLQQMADDIAYIQESI